MSRYQAQMGLLGSVTGILASVYAVQKYMIFVVQPGHKGLIFNKVTGLRDDVLHEGLHIMIPYIEHPLLFDVRTRPHKFKSQTGTKDLQMVDIGITLLFRPNPEMLSTIYRSLGNNYAERVLPSVVNEVLKAVVAQYISTQLLTQREQVSYVIRKSLEERLIGFHILLDEIAITHINFSNEFSKAVEMKQIAQQDAIKMKYVVEQAEQEKKSKIIQSQGEAIAASLYGESLRENQVYLELRRIEQSIINADKLARSRNSLLLDSDPLLLNLTSKLSENLEKDPLAGAQQASEAQLKFLQAINSVHRM